MSTKSLGFSITALDKATAQFVKIGQAVERLERHVTRLDGKTARVRVDADTSRAHRKLETLDKSFGAATIRVAALGRAMGTLALPAAIVGATPAIASLGASAVQASGALWLLPAAATAGGIAFAGLKVGMAGFGEAMKNLDDPAKFAEAIARLSPAAREAATTIRGLVPAWTSMQQVVQQNLFAGVASQIQRLAGAYLPMLKSGLGGTATALNQFAMNFAAFAMAPRTLADIPILFTNINAAITNLAPVVNNLLGIFRDVAVVGSAFLPGLATGFVNATQSAQTFVHTARETGQLAVWIQNGINTLRQLGQLSANVGSILGSMFGAAERSGESFLGMLVRVTGQLAAGLKTPEGAAGLQEFFTTVRTLVGLLWDKLVQLWPAIVAAGGAFAALAVAAAPMSSVIFDLVVSGLVPLLNTIRDLAPVIGPLVPIFFAVAGAVKLWTLATRAAAVVGPVLSGAMWVLRAAMNGTLLSTIALNARMAAGLAMYYAKAAATGVATAAQWLWTAAVNSSIVGLLASTAAMIGQRVAMLAGAAAMAVVRGAVMAWTAVQWLLNSALLANPIGLVVIAIAGLVAAFIWAWNSSETFRGIIIAGWNAIRAAAVAVWGAIVAFFTTAWNTIRTVAVTVWNAIAAFFTGAFNAFVAFFTGIWNAVSAAFVFAWNYIRYQATVAWMYIQSYFYGALNAFLKFFTDIWTSVSNFFTTAWNWIRTTATTIWNAIVAYFQAAFAYYSAFFQQVWNNILAVFRVVWNWLRDTAVNAWNGIYNFFAGAFSAFTTFFRDTWNNIVGTFDRIWSSITDIARRVWEGVRNAFVEGINWVIDKINIFADAINKVAGLLGFEIDLRIPKLGTGGPVNMAAASAGANALARARQDGGPIGLASGGGVNAATGGLLPGRHAPGRDTLPALAGGTQRYMLDGGEYVINRDATAALGAGTMAAINNAHRNPVDVVSRQRRARLQDGGVIYRATGGELGAAAQRGVPGTRVTSTYRPGVPGYHGRNQAADLAGPRRMDTAFMHRINRWIADNHGAATNELIFTPGINLLNGRPHTYNAGTRADHHDHVHWAMAGPIAGGQGGVFSAIVSFLLDQAKALLNPVRDMLIPIKDDPASGFGKRAMAGGGLKMIDWLFAVAEAQDAAANAMGPAGPGSGPVVDQVRAVANRYGWGSGPQWDALSRLIQKESSWNPNAQNPTSTAYGLFQFLNGTWGTVGGSNTSNPGQQAEYGLRYIRQRYNDPVGALRFHNANNWYDQGGLAVGRGVMMKETLRPERVLDPRTTVTFERFTDWLSSPASQRTFATGRPGQFATMNPAIAAQLAQRPAAKAAATSSAPLIAGDVHLVTAPGTSVHEAMGALSRELRVAKHGGRYRR